MELTKEEALKYHKQMWTDIYSKIEPFTDKEQRIFLAAIEREREICKEVDSQCDGNVSLTKVCSEIERKVKKVLWS